MWGQKGFETKPLSWQKHKKIKMAKPKYHVVENKGLLSPEELDKVLKRFPFEYHFAKEESDPRNVGDNFEIGTMEVYHKAAVISLFPQPGMRVSTAYCTDWDFLLRPDNMLDDTLGLRCCFHPSLSSFSIAARPERGVLGEQIEIDIHKFPKKSRDRRYVRL